MVTEVNFAQDGGVYRLNRAGGLADLLRVRLNKRQESPIGFCVTHQSTMVFVDFRPLNFGVVPNIDYTDLRFGEQCRV